MMQSFNASTLPQSNLVLSDKCSYFSSHEHLKTDLSSTPEQIAPFEYHHFSVVLSRFQVVSSARIGSNFSRHFSGKFVTIYS